MNEDQPYNEKNAGAAAQDDGKPSPLQDEEFNTALKLFDKSFDLIEHRLPRVHQSAQPSAIGNLARLLSVSSDQNLYHYTTDAGLQGIIEQGCFHASSDTS